MKAKVMTSFLLDVDLKKAVQKRLIDVGKTLTGVLEELLRGWLTSGDLSCI